MRRYIAGHIMESSVLRPGDGRASLAVAAVAALLILLAAAPVALAPSDKLFGSEIVGRHADAYTMIRHFESPLRLRFFTQPVTDWVGVLVGKLLGGAVAYNLVVLATFPLAALTTFWLARFLGLTRGGAAVSSLAFAFSPFHLAHAAYHPHIAQVQWIPMYLLALAACVERWTVGRCAFLILAAGLCGLSNFYAGLILGVLTPIAILGFARMRRSVEGAGDRQGRGWIATSATLVALAGGGWLYVRAVAPDVLASPDRFGFPVGDLARYGATWWSYFVPSVEHPVLGAAAMEIWQRHGIADGLLEQQVYLSFALLALAAAGCVAWLRKDRQVGGVAAVPALLAIGAVAFYASLGPVQRLPGGGELPRLSALLHPLLPIFRAYARFGAVLFLAVALVAGVGFAALWRRPRVLRAAAVLAGLVLVFELAPVPWRWHWILPTEAHRWLAQAEGGMKILDCVPASPAARSVSSLVREHRFAFLDRSVEDCGEPGLSGKLAARGHSHLLVRAEDPLRAVVPREGLELVMPFADADLYRVVARQSPIYLTETEGFSWRETDGTRSWRWMERRGHWRIENIGADAVAAELEITLASFHLPRRLEVVFDGESLAMVEVGTAPAVFVLPLEVSPGSHRLVFVPDGEPASPAEILGSGDTRELTVSVGDWRWLIGSSGRG